MAQVTIKNFLEAGVHFGHQTRKWNPKMAPYIFGSKNKIHIIDLQKTLACMKEAQEFIGKAVSSGKEVLFVGTKRQAQISIKEAAERCGVPYVNQRWLGGMLTNFATIKNSINKMKHIRGIEESGDFGPLTKKERGSLVKERTKMEKNLGGIKDMKNVPGAIIVIDPKREHIAVKEANKLHIPVIALVDTNTDPDGVDILIPGNDDAIRSINLICHLLADAVIYGKAHMKEPVKAIVVDVAEDVVDIAEGADVDEPQEEVIQATE